MDLNLGITTSDAGQDVAVQRALEALALENARLRQLVGELLLKNQHLREPGVSQPLLPEPLHI